MIEGDKQVPEGLYKIEGFNPNSSYHLSMKLNYPNAFDLQHANKEGRSHTDPSLNELHAPSNSPEWVGKLYEEIVTQYNTVTKNSTALK